LLVLEDGRVERYGLDAFLDPVDENSEVRLRERSVRLIGVGRAVRGSWHEEEFVPIIERGGAFIERQVRVHGAADRLVVAHRRGGGDAVVGLAVEVEDFAPGRVEGRQVRSGRVQRVLVGLPAFDHPAFERVVGDSVEVGEGGAVEQVEVAGYEFAAELHDAELP
jgi:hypothetical protein